MSGPPSAPPMRPEAQLDEAFLVWQYLNLVLFGMYMWEVLVTLPFDLALLTRRKEFRWTFLPYFVGRYCLLGSLLTFNIFIFSISYVDCNFLYIIMGTLSNISMGCASVCLAIRTVAIWRHNRGVLAVLIATGLVQWAFLLRDISFRRAQWVDESSLCLVIQIPLSGLLFLYIPTIVFDLVVLVLTAIGLRRGGSPRSPLQTLVFKQGLIYFVSAFTSNLLPVIFILGQSRAPLCLMFTFVAMFTSTVASCRMVRGLELFGKQDQAQREMQISILQQAGALLMKQVKGKLSAGTDRDVLSTIIFTSITSKGIAFELSVEDQNLSQLRDVEAQLPIDREAEHGGRSNDNMSMYNHLRL